MGTGDEIPCFDVAFFGDGERANTVIREMRVWKFDVSVEIEIFTDFLRPLIDIDCQHDDFEPH